LSCNAFAIARFLLYFLLPSKLLSSRALQRGGEFLFPIFPWESHGNGNGCAVVRERERSVNKTGMHCYRRVLCSEIELMTCTVHESSAVTFIFYDCSHISSSTVTRSSSSFYSLCLRSLPPTPFFSRRRPGA